MYDFISTIVSFGKWKNWTYSLLPYLKPPNILEIGVGPGHLLIKMSKSGTKVFGVDESFQMLNLTKNNLQSLKKSNLPLPFLPRCKAQNLPFPNGVFTSVIASFPTSYILDSQTISEISRVLTNQGILAILFGIELKPVTIPEKILAKLYQFTKESVPDSNWQEIVTAFFLKAGFSAEWKLIPSPPALLYILYCSRNHPSGDFDVK